MDEELIIAIRLFANSKPSMSTGNTPLMRAVLAHDIEAVKKYATPIEIRKTNGIGWNALHIACANPSNEDIIKYLIEKAGVDVNSLTKGGKGSPIIVATFGYLHESQVLKYVDILLSLGADATYETLHGASALSFCLVNGFDNAISMILKKRNVDVNKVSFPGRHANIDRHGSIEKIEKALETLIDKGLCEEKIIHIAGTAWFVDHLLKKKFMNIEERLTTLEYLPGGPMFQLAQSNFEAAKGPQGPQNQKRKRKSI